MGTRMLTAVAVLVSAALHLYLWIEGYRDVEIIGPAFLLNAVGGAVIALLVLASRHWVTALLAVGFGLATLGALVLSATVGLFGFEESWQGWEVWTAAISEVAAIVLGSFLLVRANPLASRDEAKDHASVHRPHLH